MPRLSNDRYANFLNKVLEKTKSNDLTWKYLDHDETLCKGMNWRPDYSESDDYLEFDDDSDFNIEQSFCCKSNNTYIVLLVYGTNPANIFVVPNTFRNTVLLSAEEYGDIITRLLNIVRSQFPDGEVFIDKFLEE